MILNLMEEVITHSLKPIKYVVYKWHFCTRCIEWLIIKKKKQVIYKHELQDDMKIKRELWKLHAKFFLASYF